MRRFSAVATGTNPSQIFAEIKTLEEENKTVTRISITGYSLGGLIGRYLVGVLHQRKLFDTVTPVNFTTVATPHIGMVVYPTFRSRMFQALGTRLLSRTGEQFYAMDKWSATGRPLLEVMADPSTSHFVDTLTVAQSPFLHRSCLLPGLVSLFADPLLRQCCQRYHCPLFDRRYRTEGSLRRTYHERHAHVRAILFFTICYPDLKVQRVR